MAAIGVGGRVHNAPVLALGFAVWALGFGPAHTKPKPNAGGS